MYSCSEWGGQGGSDIYICLSPTQKVQKYNTMSKYYIT